MGAGVIFLVLLLKKELVGRHRIAAAVLADLHFDHTVAVWAEKRASASIPTHGGVTHIAIPRLLLGKNSKYTFVALLVHRIQTVEILNRAHHHAVGIRERFSNLPHPLLCDMGGTHNDAKGFPAVFPLLIGPQPVQSAKSSRTDLRFATTAFCDNERHTLTRKLPLDGFCHRKLRIVERISHTAHDAVVDSEHFVGKRFLGRIKKGHELAADTVSYGNAKGIEIACDIFHILKTVWHIGDCPGDLDGSALQALLQHLHHILILRLQIQHPCVHPLFQGNDLQLPEISPLAQTVEHIILKFRDQRRCRFAI